MKPIFDIVIPGFCGLGMHLTLDGFRLVYVAVAIWMWFVSGAFSKEYMAHYEKKGRYYTFFWATFLATVGVFLSADLYTTFIFFEIMSFTSYVWVAFDEKKASLKAAETYLAVAVIGGLVMLMGLFLLHNLFGTLEMSELGALSKSVFDGTFESTGVFASAKAQLYTAGALMLFGFAAKAGAFPLHIWLPKAHPVAPAPASALLSGILTKAGVFGIIIVSCAMFSQDQAWGMLIAVLGLITMFWGAFLALFSINLKRTLACSSVSQIGFILTGIGMACLLKSAGEANLLAVHGAFLHMVNHSLFKLILFLCAGAVYMNLHALDLNDIRGFGRKKPALAFCFLMGALGIGGVPGWSGYISKTLIHESMVEYMHVIGSPVFWKVAEWVFLFTGGMTIAYMLKLFIALFVEKHPTRQAEFDAKGNSYMTKLSTFVLVATALIIPVFGTLPHLTMDKIAALGETFFLAEGHPHVVHYFAFVNIKGGLISIVIGILLYFLVIRKLFMKEGRYVDRFPAWFDLENLIYRPVLQVLLPTIFAIICRLFDHVTDGFIRLVRVTALKTQDGEVKKRHHATPEHLKKEANAKQSITLIEESFSFGLILVCIGFFLTLCYLLLSCLV